MQALEALDERRRPHPQVLTVDGFQGHERRFVIFSSAKCSPTLVGLSLASVPHKALSKRTPCGRAEKAALVCETRGECRTTTTSSSTAEESTSL